MRTTLTLDDDVAVALERARAKHDLTLKAAVNEALRLGLRALEEARGGEAQDRYRLETWKSGGARIPLDSVADALAWAEGDGWK